MSDYCVHCGNTGVTWDGKICSCRHNQSSIYDSVNCLDIPEQYRNIVFIKGLVPLDIDPSYATFLDTVHSNINLGKWGNKNLLIASPIAHSKTIMAYSAINCMFRAGISVFPIFDVLEISRILTDMDMGKESVYDVSQPERVLTVPILFAKIPRSPRWDVYDNIALLIDRRVRRGTSTILLYDGTREQLIRNDKQEVLTGMFGNGYFGTIEIKSWGISNSKKDIDFEENIG